VEFKPFYEMNTNDLKILYDLSTEDQLDFSPEFLSRFEDMTLDREKLISEIGKYLVDQLARKLNVPSIQLPLFRVQAKDISNWPPDLKVQSIQAMNKNDLKILHELAKQDQLDLSPEFISRFEGMTRDRDELRSVVAKCLGDKLAKKLNVSTIKVPWSQMTADDIINWPLDVDFKTLKAMSMNDLKRLHELAKTDQIDFSPEFISRFEGIDVAKNDLKSDLTKYLGDKLAKTLNVPSMQVPWSQMKAEDIINWPSDVKFKPAYQMSIKDLKRIQELAQTDQLDFSPEIINQLKSSSRVTRERDELRSDLTKFLGDKLAKKLNVPSMKVPWSQMTAEDIINWPSGMEFKPPKKMNLKELKRLHELAKEDLLDFSQEFLSGATSNMDRKPLYSDEFKTYVTNYLTQKLARDLNVDSVRLLPWSEMTAGDIINWPSDVEFIPAYKMKTKQIRSLYELAKADKLDFSPEFLKHQLAKTKSAALELH
jgi:hypothetical protein